MGSLILEGLLTAIQPGNLLYMFLGVTFGIVIGSLPGLTVTMGVALMLPVTFGLSPTTGILLLIGVYVGGTYGGSISAILLNAPGTPASAATTLDGYPLARAGRAGEALRMAMYASTIGGIFSALMLLLIAPQLAKIALEFGPTEYFSLAFFGLTMIVNVSKGSVIKGSIMGILGMLISTIGIDPIAGTTRLTFGNRNLSGGVSLIPALIGLFAVAELMQRSKFVHLAPSKIGEYVDTKLSLSTLRKSMTTILKSSAIGTFIGSVPGTGAAIASFMSYNEAKRSSKDQSNFGKGSLDGIAASEAGNNGVTGATLIPLLTLGIPGDVVTAVILGALMMHGLTPGPLLFTNHADVVYAIMAGLLIINLFMVSQGVFASRLFVRVTTIPQRLLIPILLSLTVIGAYALNNTVFDIKVMMVFGLVGYVMTSFGFPATPMLLGIVLGPLAEMSMRQALIISAGDWTVFFTSPISLVFLLLAFASLAVPAVRGEIARFRRRVGSAPP